MSHIEKKVALLESMVDVLESELSYLGSLLVKCGFEKGISSLKEAALSLLSERGD